jgi:hypothetical protein
MIQRGSDTNFTKLWSLFLYIQLLLHFVVNAQENKKNTILSYKKQSGKYSKNKKKREKLYACLDIRRFLVLISVN